MLVAAHSTDQRSSASPHQPYTSPSNVIASMSSYFAASCLSPRDAAEGEYLRSSAAFLGQAAEVALAAANAVAMHSGDRGSSSRQALSSLQASSSRQASGGGGVQTRFVTIVRKMHSGWTGVKLVIAALLSFFLFLGVVFCRFKVDILSSRACQVVD